MREAEALLIAKAKPLGATNTEDTLEVTLSLTEEELSWSEEVIDASLT